jgi:hypothetical protein
MAAQQAGLLTRRQLAIAGMNRWAVLHRIERERWQLVAPDVVATTTGELTLEQRKWRAVLHGGESALLAGLSAAQDAGLERWERPYIEVLLPHSFHSPQPLDGAAYRRTRHDLRFLRDRHARIPRCRVEPAVLLFAATERSERTAAGVLAAVVQQRLTTPERLLASLDDLTPLRRARTMRIVLDEIAGGAQSLGEIDVKRMCRQHRIVAPRRQTRRRDGGGRLRFTDCEWDLVGGRTLVLEVDGGFHMEVEHWEDDLARQRALASPNRTTVHCTPRELRDTPDEVARDLIKLGVPRRLGVKA